MYCGFQEGVSVVCMLQVVIMRGSWCGVYAGYWEDNFVWCVLLHAGILRWGRGMWGIGRGLCMICTVKPL